MYINFLTMSLILKITEGGFQQILNGELQVN